MSTPDTTLRNEIIEHLETLTHEMRTSFQAVNAQLDHIDARLEKIEEAHIYHKEILLSHGELLRQLLKQKSGE